MSVHWVDSMATGLGGEVLNGARDGRFEAPFFKIGAATESAVPGDIIVIMPGHNPLEATPEIPGMTVMDLRNR